MISLKQLLVKSLLFANAGLLCNFNPCYAFSLTIVPSIPQEYVASPGEKVSFFVSLGDIPQDIAVLGYNFSIGIDGQELSNPVMTTPGGTPTFQQLDFLVTAPTESPLFSGVSSQTLANLTFDVKNPLKDGNPDVYFKNTSTILYLFQGTKFVKEFPPEPRKDGADVVPVPEPITVFSLATALGFGFFLKKKYPSKEIS